MTESQKLYFTDGTIRQFRGEYEIFSNFTRLAYTGPDGIRYPGVEWGFQAGKTLDHDLRRDIAALPTPNAAKHAGRGRIAIPSRSTPGETHRLVLRANWKDDLDKNVMATHKLAQINEHPEFLEILLKSYPHAIFEGNYHGDHLWGVDAKTGLGTNRLGRLYMRLRELLMAGPVTIPYRAN